MAFRMQPKAVLRVSRRLRVHLAGNSLWGEGDLRNRSLPPV